MPAADCSSEDVLELHAAANSCRNGSSSCGSRCQKRPATAAAADGAATTLRSRGRCCCSSALAAARSTLCSALLRRSRRSRPSAHSTNLPAAGMPSARYQQSTLSSGTQERLHFRLRPLVLYLYTYAHTGTFAYTLNAQGDTPPLASEHASSFQHPLSKAGRASQPVSNIRLENEPISSAGFPKPGFQD